MPPAQQVLDRIETGATLSSGTSIAGNTAFHHGNDNGQLDADTISGGAHAADIARDTIKRNWLGLHGWWTFDAGFSNRAGDYSSHGRTADFKNGATTTTGGYDGRGFQGDGTDNYAVVPNWKGITGRTPRTWMCWFKSGSNTNQRFISYGTNNSGQKYDIRTDSNNGNVLRVENAGGQKYGSTAITDGNWHHLAVVFPDGGTDVQDHDLYVDGALETTTGGGSQSLDTAAGNDLWLGASSHHGNHIDGVLDSVRGYARELTQSEIQDIMNGVA